MEREREHSQSEYQLDEGERKAIESKTSPRSQKKSFQGQSKVYLPPSLCPIIVSS